MMGMSQKKINENTEAENFRLLLKKMDGDEKLAMEEFNERYGKLIKATARAFLRNKSDIDAVYDDVLVKIWQGRDRLSDVRNPQGLIVTTTCNIAKTALKRNGSRRFCLLDENVPAPNDDIEKFETDEAFLSLIEPLPEKARLLMTLKFVGELSFREIAEIFKTKLTTVSSLYYRSLEKLKETILAERKEEEEEK